MARCISALKVIRNSETFQDLMWLIGVFPVYVVACNFIDTHGAFNALALMVFFIIFTDMIKEDYKTSLIDIRNVAGILGIVFFIIPHTLPVTMKMMLVWFSQLEVVFSLSLLLYAMGNFLSHNKSSQKTYIDTKQKKSSYPLLPFLGAGLFLYSITTIFLCNYQPRCYEIYTTLNKVGTAAFYQFITELSLFHIMFFCFISFAAIYLAVHVSSKTFFRGTEVSEIHGIIAQADIIVLAILGVFFGYWQFCMIVIFSTLSLLIWKVIKHES